MNGDLWPASKMTTLSVQSFHTSVLCVTLLESSWGPKGFNDASLWNDPFPYVKWKWKGKGRDTGQRVPGKLQLFASSATLRVSVYQRENLSCEEDSQLLLVYQTLRRLGDETFRILPNKTQLAIWTFNQQIKLPETSQNQREFQFHRLVHWMMLLKFDLVYDVFDLTHVGCIGAY